MSNVKIVIIMATVLLISQSQAIFAGPNCGGCLGSKKAKKECDIKNDGTLSWSIKEMRSSDSLLIKIRIAGKKKNQLIALLNKEFRAPIKSGSMKILNLSSQLWVKTDKKGADKVDAFLKKQKKKKNK